VTLQDAYPRVRVDSLPEGEHFPDEGCPQYGCHSALTCPFETCIAELPLGVQSLRKEMQASLARRMRAAGRPVKGPSGIAAALGMSARNVFRYLKEGT